MRATRTTSTAALAAIVLLALVPLRADAQRSGDPCDWISFRNGLRNQGSSACTGIGAGNVATLVPTMLYRTRDSVSATPAVVDGVAYVGSWDGWFYAFDTEASGFGDPSVAGTPASGVEPKWQTRIDDGNGVSFGRIVSSATVADVDGYRVVVFGGGATVYVLDAGDGAVLARACLDPRDHDRCAGSGDHEIEIESSPAVVPEPGKTASIVVGLDVHNASGIGRTGVVKLRLSHAGPNWALETEWKYDPEAGAALKGPGALTAGSGTGGGCGGVWGTPAVEAGADLVVFGTGSCSGSTAGPDGVPGSGDEDVRAEEVFGISFRNGGTRWRFTPERPQGPHVDDDLGSSPVLYDAGGRLLAGIGSKDGWFHALDAATGTPVWQTHVGQAGHLNHDFAIGGVLGSPALGVAGDHDAIFVTTAISTPVGAPVDDPSADTIDRSLAEDPGRLLSLHAIDAGTGQILWRQPLTRQTYGHPTYANGLVFVPSTASFSVQAFAADSGAPVWSSPPLNGPPSSGVAVTADGIFLGAGTRQTDAGFKLTGADSVLPAEVAGAVPPAPADLVGADPQQRMAGIWAFHLPAATGTGS